MTRPVPLSHRPNVADELASAVRDMIFDGRLAAGSRINEVHLATDLGVSRTPLREALASLLSEGALLHLPRRGYFVRELTAEEVEEIYPIRAYLDPEALRLAGLPAADRLARLETINADLRKARSARRAIRLDDQWHFTLWGDCPNRVLVSLIEQFMRRTRRYELALMGQRENVARTVESKTRILDHLRQGAMDAACRRLRRSLMDARKPILRWLREREA